MPTMFDAVFLGRFHHQKGVLELVDIWDLVNKRLPNATLVMIGNGALWSECKARQHIRIYLTGPLYGKERNDIIKSCKVAVHPAQYDSGGMSLAICLGFGLPGVMYQLPNLRDYYTEGEGIIKVKTKEEFAEAIVKLLNDDEYYYEMSDRAYAYAKREWSWEARAEKVWKNMTLLL